MPNYEFLYKMIPVNSKGVAACLQSKYVIEELDKERSSGKFIDAYVFCEVLERVYAEHVDKGFDPDFAKNPIRKTITYLKRGGYSKEVSK